MSFRDKVAQQIQEKTGNQADNIATEPELDNIEAFVSSTFFGVDNLRNSPSCLDLRLANGTFKALPYSYIIEINYDPSDGIEITTTTKKICITGRNLKLLYNYLVSYRIRYIQANIGNDLTEEKLLFVKDIVIEES
jgi:hypothetical protein